MDSNRDRLRNMKQQLEDLMRQVKEKHFERKNVDGLFQVQNNLGELPKSTQILTRKILKGHFGKVYAMHWGKIDDTPANQDPEKLSTNLVSASQDGKLLIWNGLTANKLQAIALRSAWVMTCSFEPEAGHHVACGGLDNVCSIYRTGSEESTTHPLTLSAHDGYLSCCRFLNAREIITSSGDSTCMIWDIERSSGKGTFTDHSGDVMSVSINPTDPNVFVSGSCDTTAKVWDIREGKCVQTFVGHQSDINSVQFLANGQSFVTGSDDAYCRLFDMRCYCEINNFTDETILCGITSVATSNSGRLLFAGYDDFNCFVWDVTKEKNVAQVYSLYGHENRVSCLGMNVTGQAFCTGSWDCLLKIWA